MKLNLYPLFLLILIALLCLLTLFSCNAKKNTIERTFVSDTLKTASITYKTEPIQTNYTIDLVCDTLTGKIKNVNFKDYSGKNSANLIIENNQLKAQLKVSKTESTIDTIYQTKIREVYKDKNVVKYKTPLWMWLVIIFEALIIFLLFRFK